MELVIRTRSRFLTLITLFLLVNATLYSLGVFSTYSNNWVYVDYSFNSSTGGKVYPGSLNTQLVVIARYIGMSEAVNPIACLATPTGFQKIDSCVPARDFNEETLHVVKTGNITYFKFRLNIDRELSPGNYSVYINITYFNTVDSKVYWDTVSLVLEISPHPPLDLEIIDSYFSPYNYLGARYVSIVIGIVNKGETLINNLRLNLNLPPKLVEPHELNYTYSFSIPQGSEVYLNIGAVTINSNARPYAEYTGVLNVRAQLITSDNVLYSDEKSYSIILTTGGVSEAELSVLTYELTSNTALPGLRNTGLRILIQSQENGVVRIQYSRVLFENAELVNGSSTAIYVHEVVLNYLDVAWITYSGVSIYDNVTCMRINATIHGVITRDNVDYPFSLELWFTIPLVNRELDIVIEKTYWSSSIAYPGSTGNNLVVAIFNNESNLSITDAIVELDTQNTTYPDNLSTYNVLIESSSLVEVVYSNIAVPESTSPGFHEVSFKITGILRCIDNSFKYITIYRKSFIIVSNYTDLEPVLPIFSIIDTYWGELTPQYIYPGNARAPLTIVLQNNGIATALNTVAVIDNVEPSDVNLLSRAAQCSLQLTPASICSAVFYLDLTNSSSGLKTISLSIRYNLDLFGISTLFKQYLVTRIYLPRYPPGGGVVIASYNWLNNYPVFNGSKRATLVLTITNLEPYPVGSIWITLKTPIGINIHKNYSNTIYLPGPIASLQIETATFTLDLDCPPSVYQAVVEFDYFIQSYLGGARRRHLEYISLNVECGSDGVELVTYGWLTTPQPPPVYGARLYIVFRNLKYPSISNPVLKIELPSGVVDSRTNSSKTTLLPLVVSNPQQLFMNQISPSIITELLTQITQQTYTSSISKGSFITYVLTLNIERDYTVLSIPYTLVFIDHWGEEYSVSSVFSIKLLSAPALINIYPKTPLIKFSNGTALLDVVLENNYNTPIANVYVVLVPVSGNAISLNALRYLDKLNGRTSTVIRFELIYNPVQTQFGSIQLSSPSAIFTITLIYNDITGALHSINTTFAVIVKPFIELTIVPGITAKYSKGVLSISGVVANIGISTAKSTIVYLKYGEAEAMSIIGDIDPSSQTPFRLEVKTLHVGEKCFLVIKYLDEYGVEYYLSRELEVTIASEESSLVNQPKGDSTIFKYIVIAIVVSFLAAVFFTIYRQTRRATKEGRV